jgi:hypothetical protein
LGTLNVAVVAVPDPDWVNSGLGGNGATLLQLRAALRIAVLCFFAERSAFAICRAPLVFDPGR